MPLRITNILRPVEEPESELADYLMQRLKLRAGDILSWRILRKSLDARSRRSMKFVYSILVEFPPKVQKSLEAKNENDIVSYSPQKFKEPSSGSVPLDHPPVIVGAGPAGLLAGYYLALKGYRPVIIDRGESVKQRVKAIREFDRGGELDPENNYLFGEGGAGCFSDGKLTCRISGPDVDWVLQRFVDCGGKESILYEHRPHLGSNKLPLICRNLRRRIEVLGGSFRFGCCLKTLQIENRKIVGLKTNQGIMPTSQLVLAIGHSARDTYRMLHEQGVPFRQKAFQLGLRIEQPQENINKQNYGKPEYLKILGAADYSLIAPGQRDLFTFCMCAGGYIIPSISEPNMFCTNGMSNSKHDSPYANSGLVVTLEPEEFGNNHPLAGVHLQQKYEALAFELAGKNYFCPVQTAEDFLAEKPFDPSRLLECSYRRGAKPIDLSPLLPPQIISALRLGMKVMDEKWHGNFLKDAILVGPEMRGSSPVRIERDRQTREVPEVSGLYPVGEGAGYAGGIMTAAVDGLLTAKTIAANFAPLQV